MISAFFLSLKNSQYFFYIDGSPFSQRVPATGPVIFDEERCREDANRIRPTISRPVPAAICIFHAFRYLSEPVYHIWRFEVSITLSWRNVTSPAVPFPTDICPSRLGLSRCHVQRFSGERIFPSLFFFFCTLGLSRRQVISKFPS